MTTRWSLKVGLIGCGYWGPNYVRLLAHKEPGARLVACADHSRAAREWVNRVAPRISTYATHGEMLEAEPLDAIVIATQATTHAQIAMDCLEAGVPVLVEKPLARTVAEGVALVDLGLRKHLQVAVAHTYLFNPHVQVIKEIIKRGDLGQPITARFERTAFGPVREDVGALWDLASHDVSMLNYWCETLPIDSVATGRCHLRPGIDDFVVATLSYSSGFLATLSASWMEPVKVRRVTMCGDEAMLVFDDAAKSSKLTIYKKRAYLASGGVYAVDDGLMSPDTSQVEPLAAVVEDFIGAVRGGCAPFCPGEFGVDVVRVLEALQESMDAHEAPTLSRDVAVG